MPLNAAALDARLERAFHRLDAMPVPRALLVLALASLGANLFLAFAVALPVRELGLDPRSLPDFARFVRRDFLRAVLIAVVAVPLLETWVFQALPLWVARHWTGRPTAHIALSAGLFAGAHAIGHLTHGLTQVGGGVVLAFTFFWASRRPWRPRPVLATWAVHAANNLAVVAFLYWAADFIRRSPP